MRTAFTALAVVAVAVAHAQSIQNGSFENPPVGAWDYFSNGQVANWSIGGGSKAEIGKSVCYGVTGADGINVTELDSDRNTAITQSVDLAAGTYDLSFLFAKRGVNLEYKPTDTCDFDVLWNGGSVAYVTPTDSTMTRMHLNVLATAGTNTVTFRGRGTSDGYGAILDGVGLQAVPEPGSMAVLGGAALAVVRKRRQTRQ
ncbi:MAG: PEP-CTERM sorting domain-containing protein [Armatimonadetes bacterium]|nr:PEP-CTERM sorting domain-containing protein [Armatimonadota bacterium]